MAYYLSWDDCNGIVGRVVLYNTVLKHINPLGRDRLRIMAPSSDFLSVQAQSGLSPVHPSQPWFDYPVRVHPHHTDYAGIAWHGTYVSWLEEARAECLRSHGVVFSDLVALGCDLPVVELSIRYRQSLKMGMEVFVSTRMLKQDGVRLNWVYTIQSKDYQTIYATATVTLVPVDRTRGKIIRQLPPVLKQALDLCCR